MIIPNNIKEWLKKQVLDAQKKAYFQGKLDCLKSFRDSAALIPENDFNKANTLYLLDLLIKDSESFENEENNHINDVVS